MNGRHWDRQKDLGLKGVSSGQVCQSLTPVQITGNSKRHYITVADDWPKLPVAICSEETYKKELCVANWRKQLAGMDPLKPVILNNSSCACLAFAFLVYLSYRRSLSISCAVPSLLQGCKCTSVQRPNHCTEVSASIFTSPSSSSTNDTGICYWVHVDKFEADVSTWILTALTGWMLWQALPKKEQGPIVQSPFTGAPDSKAPMPDGHIHWTFLGQLESNRFVAVKTCLPCRPGRSINCDTSDILMGKPHRQASSQLPRTGIGCTFLDWCRNFGQNS